MNTSTYILTIVACLFAFLVALIFSGALASNGAEWKPLSGTVIIAAFLLGYFVGRSQQK